MALPTKQYFTLKNLSDSWGINDEDLRYYIEHDELQVCCWLDLREVVIYQQNNLPKYIYNLNVCDISGEYTRYEGYVGIYSRDVRKVFRVGKYGLSNFINLDREGDLISLMPHVNDAIISISDLMVTCKQKEIFEKKYDIIPKNHHKKKDDCRLEFFGYPAVSSNHFAEDNANQYIKPKSFSGRPSVMFKIEQQMKKRSHANILEQSLAKESESLYLWASNNIKDVQIPKAASIKNALRHEYKKLKEQTKIPKKASN